MTNAIIATAPISNQATSDDQLIGLWLHGKKELTRQAYAVDVARFRAAVARPLSSVGLGDLQAYADSLAGLGINSQRRYLASVKSLLTFGQRVGYLPFNVGAALRMPQGKDTLAERILSEAEVHRMIALTTGARDSVLITLLYASAGRVAEVCALTWRDVQPNRDSGQVTLFGKRDKTRSVKISRGVWLQLCELRQGAGAAEPVFRSAKGGHLDESQVWRIVRASAKRAGIAGNVSPHWLRHSHASHAIERGAPVTLVRDTLGHATLETTSRYAHARPDQSSGMYLAV
jgi:integrase/recombinase XerD